jgi:hypothetical protein
MEPLPRPPVLVSQNRQLSEANPVLALGMLHLTTIGVSAIEVICA